MDSRFGNLTQAALACLSAANLLTRSGVTPLDRRRLLAIQSLSLGLSQTESQQDAALEELGDLGLMTSALGDDILVFQPGALLHSSSGEAPLCNSDLALLVNALAPLGDLDVLYRAMLDQMAKGNYQAALDLSLALLAWFDTRPHEAWERRRADTAHNAGVSLALLERFDEALAYFDKAILENENSPDADGASNAAEAMFGKCYALRALGRTNEALVSLDAMAERFNASDAPAVKEALIKAFCLRANLLFETGSTSEALDILRGVERRFGDDCDTGTRTRVAFAMRQQRQILECESRFIDVLACCSELDRRFAADRDETIRELVAESMVKRAEILARLGRHQEASVQYQDASGRYMLDTTPAMRAVLDRWRPAQSTANEESPKLFRTGDIDTGWIASQDVPNEILAAAAADLRREGPEEFKDFPASACGWQALASVPGWWLIRLIPRCTFWGYGLYCLWTHGRVLTLSGTGIELRTLSREGQVRITTEAAAWEWYRLRGIGQMVGSYPKYSFIDVPVEEAGQLSEHTDVAQVHPHAKGWAITCWRLAGVRLEKIMAVMDASGHLVEEEVIRVIEDAVPPAESMLMTPGSLADYLVAMIHSGYSIATVQEQEELANMNLGRMMLFWKIVAFPIAVALVLAIWLWRLGRTVVVLPLLPGLVISRYVPTALDIRAATMHRILAFVEGRPWRRVAAITIWYAALTLVCARAQAPFAQLAAAAFVIAYAHTSFVFLRNEATRLSVFRHSAKEARYLSQLHDFIGEYIMCAAAFLLTLPLLLNVLLAPVLQNHPELPITAWESYRFTLTALLLEVPEVMRTAVPFLSSLHEPEKRDAQMLQSAIQYLFHLSAMTLLVDKIWAMRGLRAEADERLQRSLREAVALGDRAAKPLLRIIATGVNPDKVRMAVLALGLIGDARHRERLQALKVAGAAGLASAEFDIALALLGDDTLAIGEAPLILPPSLHGGDDPLNLSALVAALRTTLPVPEAIPTLRRMLSWQGVSQALRHSAMLALLRIPGAFSATDAINWTKEFVGASIVTDKQADLLDLFGVAALSLPVEELATAIAHEWFNAPLISLIALAKYQARSMVYRLKNFGFDGYAAALYLAGYRAMEKRKERRKLHPWRIVDLVLRRLDTWETGARWACFGATCAGAKSVYLDSR